MTAGCLLPFSRLIRWMLLALRDGLNLRLGRKRRFSGKILRDRTLLDELLPELLSLRCWDVPPASIDLSLSQFFCDLRTRGGDRFQCLRRPNHVELVPLGRRFERGIGLVLGSKVEFVIRDLLTPLLLD